MSDENRCPYCKYTHPVRSILLEHVKREHG